MRRAAEHVAAARMSPSGKTAKMQGLLPANVGTKGESSACLLSAWGVRFTGETRPHAACRDPEQPEV